MQSIFLSVDPICAELMALKAENIHVDDQIFAEVFLAIVAKNNHITDYIYAELWLKTSISGFHMLRGTNFSLDISGHKIRV